MRAPDLYQQIVGAMETLGYTRWRTTLSFREVPEAGADRLFQVVPVSVEPQIALLGLNAGTYAIDTIRKFRISVLYRVLGSVFDVIRQRVLVEEERITDLLLSMDEAVSVTATYADADEGGGFVLLSLELEARYDRPA